MTAEVERVIDGHLHIMPLPMIKADALSLLRASYDDFESVAELMLHPTKLLNFLDAQGVEKAVLVNYVSPQVLGFTEEVNDWVAAFVKEAPDRLVACGSVHPRLCKDPASELKRIIYDLGVRVLKIHPPHQLFFPNDYRCGDAALEQVYKVAEESSIPIIFHTGTSIFPRARNQYGDPMFLDDVAVDFPRLKIVIAHGGRPLWTETAFFLLRRHSNVFLDISGIPPQRLLSWFPRVEEFAHKTLFGSDWPGPGVRSIRANVEQLCALPLSKAARKDILAETALRVFAL
ncbi:MAG TPA: amidohydrolase family protein [Blastocatellia bacterium]|nr:amidohydrolase family protein [Blastocatellia bacterium]